MELDCGIARKRIDAWLDGELALGRESSRWVYRHDGATCLITTDTLESRRLGAVDIERTMVRVEGDESATEEFMRLFTLRFISAGG